MTATAPGSGGGEPPEPGTTTTPAGLIPADELDRLDAGATACSELRPGTLGHQECWREYGHAGQHVSQDRQAWT